MDRTRQRELRDLNAKAWAGEQDVFPIGASLDSSMKKNTAFIKRLRTAISPSSKDVFIQEIRTLSLHKYLSEIISACYEGLTKLKKDDVPTAVEVFSALHQRFGPDEFTAYVGWLVGRGLSTPDKAQLKGLSQDLKEREEKERLGRHRTLLRVTTELWLVGALRSLDDVIAPEESSKSKEQGRGASVGSSKLVTNGSRSNNGDLEPFPLEVLKDILAQDSHHANLTMVATFAKSFSWDLLGKKDGDEAAEPGSPLVDANMQQRFRNILVRYFESASTHLVKDQAHLNKTSRINAEAYIRSGNVFEDRQAEYDKQVKNHEKFVVNMQILGELLDMEMPDLEDKDSSNQGANGTIGIIKPGEHPTWGEGENNGIWDDEDDRRVYESLIDLKDRVPGILLEDGKKKRPDAEEHVGRKQEEKPKAELESKTDEDSTAKDEANDQSTAIANKTVGAQVDALLAQLPEMTSKDIADQIAVEFCFMNSKASRNRLLKALQEVPRGRTDLLRFYARLAATLGRYMPDISQGLVSHLDDEFRSLQRRKQKDTLSGVRTVNIRYLAELTKFGIVPEHVIFHCLKVSLDDFSKMNIEIICHLLENCGRYLLRTPKTSVMTKSFLDTLQRKKAAQHIAQQERMLIENAMHHVDPPERAAIQQKERTPLDLFVRKLVYVDLNKRNLEKIAKQLRKLHWEEDEVVEILHKIFTKPGKIKYSNIHFLAIILGALSRYHPDFSVIVIDDVIESITFGLELNDFNFNQRRIAEVRYLGELYVYRMIDSTLVFDTLFKIACFGHGGWPKPDNFCSLDLPDDFFRLRLICSLLETCGSYFEKGAAKRKLDFFLTFFQYYIFTKEPMPLDVEFLVHDMFSLLRPHWKLATGLEEAGSAFAEACQENQQNTSADKQGEAEQLDESDHEADGDGRHSPMDVDDDKSSGDELEDGDVEQIKTPEDLSDEEEQIVVTRPEDQRDPEADAEFDREFQKMMAESLADRKLERKTFDVALPVRKTQRETVGSGDDNDDEMPATSSTVQFSLMTKRGNRPQTRNIDLPADSSFAVAMRTQQEAERAEQQRIKKLVLNYDLREDSETGEYDSLYILQPNSNRMRKVYSETNVQVAEKGLVPEKPRPSHSLHNTMNNSSGSNTAGRGNRRQQQQAGRKLQVADIDWYGSTFCSNSSIPAREEIVSSKSRGRQHRAGAQRPVRGRKTNG